MGVVTVTTLIDVVGLVVISVWHSSHLHVGVFVVAVDCTRALVSSIFHKVTAWLAGSCLSDMETCALLEKLGTPPMPTQTPTPKAHHNAKARRPKDNAHTANPNASVLASVPG